MHTTTRRVGALTMAAALVATLAACSTPTEGAEQGADAEQSVTLQFASYLGPRMAESQALQWAFDEINARSNGSVTIDPIWEGGLLGGPDILSGVSQGRADAGFLTMLYNPGELPISQLGTVPFFTEDPEAAGAAYSALYGSNEAFRAEWDATGVTPLYFTGNPISVMGTTEPAASIADIANVSIRAAGYSANGLEIAGANAVSLASPEIYESVQRGVIEGWTSQIFDMVPVQSLQEVTNHIEEPGIGVYTINAFILGDRAWAELSESQQAVVSEVAAEVPGRLREVLAGVEDEACDAILEAGVDVTVWDDAAKAEWRDAIGDQIIDGWRSTVEATGVDAEAMLDEYRALLEEHASDQESGVARCAARS